MIASQKDVVGFTDLTSITAHRSHCSGIVIGSSDSKMAIRTCVRGHCSFMCEIYGECMRQAFVLIWLKYDRSYT